MSICIYNNYIHTKHGKMLCHHVNIVSPVFSLDALDPKAYKAFQASNDLQDVVERVLGGGGESSEGGDGRPSLKRGISVRASLMTPVKPMLVSRACYTRCCMVCMH